MFHGGGRKAILITTCGPVHGEALGLRGVASLLLRLVFAEEYA
jgi:hypothetical protein